MPYPLSPFGSLHGNNSYLRTTRLLPLLLLQAILPVPVHALDIPVDEGGRTELDAALGIDATFGRWNTTVKLVYDPDGAPTRFADSAHFEELIEEAFSQWTKVSGIRFELAGTDSNAVDDDESPSAQQDGLVRVFWGPAGGAAGRAGPSFGTYDLDLGYYPYDDGSLELNDDDEVWNSDLDMVGVLMHEMGHLLGLGHSDNPDSAMYANPYNHLLYPREDDIRAMQVLYGAPATAIDPSAPLTDWVYTVPATASSTSTQYLFKPNQQTTNAAHFSVNGTPVTSITSSTPDGVFVRLSSGGFGDFNAPTATDVQAKVIVVDPFGYINDSYPWAFDCPLGSACGGATIGFIQTHAIKTLPGDWKVYVVDDSGGAENGKTLLSMTLPVTTTPTYNKSPVATVSVAAGGTNTRAAFTIVVTDEEGDAINVIWRPTGGYDLNGDSIYDVDARDALSTGGSATRIFDFPLTGTHTFFVEVNDDSTRYDGTAASGISASDAGDGFQTLLRLEVTLPVTSASSLVTTMTTQGRAPTAAVLDAVSNTTPLASSTILASDGSTSTAGFSIGASRDQGSTTSTAFTVGDTVIIAGNVDVQAADAGKAGDIFIVTRSITASGDVWSYRDLDGVYRPWDGRIRNLQPAYEESSLQASKSYEIFSGKLTSGNHRMFIGYQRSDSTALHYTSVPVRLDVSN